MVLWFSDYGEECSGAGGQTQTAIEIEPCEVQWLFGKIQEKEAGGKSNWKDLFEAGFKNLNFYLAVLT